MLGGTAGGLVDGDRKEIEPVQTDELLMAKEMHHDWHVLFLIPGDRESK